MIYVRIKGGLGNQIFQYAFGRALSTKYSEELVLDISSLIGRRGNNYRKVYPNIEYRLNKYKIIENYTSNLISTYINFVRRKKLYKVFNVIAGIENVNNLLPIYIKEGIFREKDIRRYKNLYLEGHWLDPSFFEDCAHILKKELSLKSELSLQNKQYLNEIEKSNSISIHIIRGIKVEDDKHRKIYHESSMQYFLDACTYIDRKVVAPNYFVFSNDISWVKQHWPTDKHVTFIDNKGPDYEHHYLMTKCKHNIVDNSTFSYTAAMLNPNPQRIIIGPKIWSIIDQINTPKSWIIFDN